MSLSSELISQFAKITNDEKPKKSEEATLYGEVVELEEMICVRFDGAEELTPVTTIVEKDDTGKIVNYKYGAASVKSGDRVSVSLKNHSATITGNLSDPPAGRAEFKVNEDSILARVGKTELWIKEEGVTFKGLSDGTTTIDGGCIKTGTIDAKYLNLTGAISFGDLKDSTTVQGTINGAVSDASNALTVANNAASTASSAASAADSAYSRATTAINNAKAIANGTFGGGTFIDGTSIKSPVIVGGQLFALDKTSYTQMTSKGLYMYTDGHANPKVMITYSPTEVSNPNVELILGAGSSNDSDYVNRFFIKKGTDRTGLYYYDSNGNMSGLTFMANSKIEVHGTGIGTSTTVTAVWG